MIRKNLLFIFLIFLLVSCAPYSTSDRLAMYKIEILEVEKDFSDMVAQEGIQSAFLHFAANDVVLNRNNALIQGKEELRLYFDNQPLTDSKLVWSPDFVDVSSAGDLAYTYGKFNFNAKDTTGKEINASGIFHTVWKRQADGSWKYVYD